MIIQPASWAYFTSNSFAATTEQGVETKPVNNIVPTHRFLPQNDPEDTIWLLY